MTDLEEMRKRYADSLRHCECGAAWEASEYTVLHQCPSCDGYETWQATRDEGVLALCDEVEALRAKVAAAPLRLGRGPTAGEIEKHGDHGKWLVKPRDTTLGWVLRISKTIRDNPDLYTDAIALTDGGQPCPVGGWRGTT